MSEEREYAIVEPDGRIILPPILMEKYVLATPGCSIWFNANDEALGLRLLRGVDSPPYLIERRPAQSGRVEGVLEAGLFFKKVGFVLGKEKREYPARYFSQFRMLALMVGKDFQIAEHDSKGFLDTFPPLDD